jgi:Ca2+-binding RTX toxin-like protein
VVTKIGTGSDTLTLKITQDAYQGDAQYAVFVDGKQIGGTFTAKALKGSGQSDTLEIKGDWGVGNHTATVKLLNDAWGGSAALDRNLYVEGATYNGAAVPGSSHSIMRSSDTDPLGTKSFTVADSTAIPSTSTPTPTPTPTNPTGLNLQGTASADTMKGGSLGDSIAGLHGNDVIYGYGGNDSLLGGEGNDTIYGGDGNDILSGGNGSDWFIFSSSSVTAGGVDRITDFDSAADWIDLGVEFAALTNGTLRADEFRLGARAADWNDRIIYNKSTGELFYDADGNGAGAQVKFAQFTPNTSLANWDFFVY